MSVSMELHPSGYGAKIALATTFAALLVVYDVFVAVHLITAGQFPDFWSAETLGIAVSALLLLLVTVGVCLGVRAGVMSKRQAQAVAAHDPSAVAEASPQPDPALALPAGESLTLRRRYSLGDAFHALVGIVYLPGFILLLGEMVIFETLPAFGSSPLNPFYHANWSGLPGSPPPTLDWLAAALPVLLTIGLLGYVIWQSLRDRLSEIVADDTGITIRNGLHRCRVSWSEIDLFARTPETTIASPGSYIIWTHSQSLTFNFPGIEQEADYDPDSRSWSAHYIFDDGYSVYVRDARRLLATIAARAHVPLLEIRPTSERANQSRRKHAMALMTEERALALPLAAPRYAPSGDPASAGLGEGEVISLRAHIWPQPVTGDWGGDFSVWVPTIWVFGWAIGQAAGMYTYTYLWPVALASVAVVALLVTLYVMLFIRQRRYRLMPDVSANASGLTTWGRHKDQPITIPWERIAAWVVLPPPHSSIKPFRYVVVGDGLRLAWSEPTYGQYAWQSVSNPQDTYRQQAVRLHALIAARTGLPLRQLTWEASAAREPAAARA
jgi:hypothetical protein